ncbi:hypothetical protein JYU34_008150 [Plutella xylostella]|uniref:C2H2-type domain-containing protein n=1 Tax=Plutella xylostella TaxID=51655 RepID=A0ABQ7QNX0_PLUXY|nr:hypothetical protein JYU34_008150 [Plutella xylostella]
MSSFLCFLCHSTVNSETTEETRDKYREIVGMHLCPDSHLCYICCCLLNKLCLFRAMCLKRSLEYPVLFSEKGTINLQRSDLDTLNICTEDNCKQSIYSINKSLYANFNTKTYIFNSVNYNDFYEAEQDCNTHSNQYVELEDDRNDYDNASNHSNDNYITDFDNNAFNTEKANEDRNQFVDNDHNCDFVANQNEFIDKHNEFNDNENRFMDINNERHFFNEEMQIQEEDCNETANNRMEYKENAHSEAEILEMPVNVDNQSENIQIEIKIEPCTQEINHKSDQIAVPTENNEMNDDSIDPTKENTVEKQKKTKKNKKAKKKSFTKIVLSFKEQKSVLEAMRKEKKYLEAEFKCHSCALGFLFKDTYQSHMVRHEELHRCNKCGVEVKRTHKARHSRDCWGQGAGSSCHLCGKLFRDSACLQQHLKRFHAARSSPSRRQYSCHACGQTFPEQTKLRTHMLSHLTAQFPCDRCPATFRSPYSRRRHRASHDAPSAPPGGARKRKPDPVDRESHECPVCGRDCPTPRALTLHLETHSTRLYSCAQCGASRASRRRLARHVASHRAPVCAQHQCHLCGNVYKSTSKLNRHIREVCERARLEEQLASLYEHENDMHMQHHHNM